LKILGEGRERMGEVRREEEEKKRKKKKKKKRENE
jgi:hypothetical protein